MTGHPELEILLRGGAGRLDALAHVASCAECRAAVAAADASRLFALLALESIPASALARVSAGVERALEADAARRRAGRRAGLAALAASVLLAAALSAYLAGSPLAPGAARARDAAQPAAKFELLDAPGSAQVVRMDLGGTELVMVIDEALDL